MSNYYYSPQQTLSKQSSQILSPIPGQQLTHTILRSSLTDRSHYDSKTPHLSPSPHIQSISRDGSTRQLHEIYAGKVELTAIPQKNNPLENQRAFSDYQIGASGIKGDDSHLPVGGGFNISNKLGEKIKNKTQLHKSNSRGTLCHQQGQKASSIRIVQSIIEGEKVQFIKLESCIQIINQQIGRIIQKMALHQQKIQRLQKSTVKSQQINSSPIFTNPHAEQINKILTFLQKTQQRDDYRKAMKMIEELRGNILQLNCQVKQLQQSKKSPFLDKNLQSCIKPIILDIFKEKQEEVRKDREHYFNDMVKKMNQLSQQFKEWRKNHQDQLHSTPTSSVKKFQGKMTTLLYQQKISMISQGSNSLTLGTSITKPLKHDSPAISDKQNKQSSSILTSRTYYIDNQGYLLDKNKYYLLNNRNQQIKLTEKEMDLLKRHCIL